MTASGRPTLRDLVGAAPRLLLVWAGLPVFGIRAMRRWTVRKRSRGSAAPEFDPAAWRRRAGALASIGARLPGCRCLARSIALGWWLDARGFAHTLKIGVAGTHATLRSHSWVESNGHLLDDTPENINRFKQITKI